MDQGNYRLTLEKVGVDDDGDRVWENVIEVTDTPDGIVNAWLPTVSLRLGGGLMPPPVSSVPIVADAPGVPVELVPEAETPKRKRRTKAEIAADEAAKAAGYPSAAAMPVPAAGASVEHDTAQALKDAIPAQAQEDMPMASFENGPQTPPIAPAQAFNPFAAMVAG